MKDRRQVAWLYAQLPGLVSAGVLPSEVAERLRQHYGTVAARTRRSWALTLFSILGAGLIGSGILLLLAHNWEDLSRPVRAVIALAPLLVAQGLAGWVLWRRDASTAWREGVGTFLTLAIGMSIALIGQTYHLGGDLGEFLLTWVVLALPVAYLLQATLPALLYLIGITVWTGTVNGAAGKVLGYWPLLLAVVPYMGLVARRNRYDTRLLLLSWLLGITLPIALGFSLYHVIHPFTLWLFLASSLAGVMYLSGAQLWAEATTLWQRPWQTLGALGIVGIALVLSFTEVWKEVMRLSLEKTFVPGPWPSHLAWVLVIVWPVAAVGLWVDSMRRGDVPRIVVGAMPVVAMGGYVLVHIGQTPQLGMLLLNAYVLTLGIGLLVAGIREQRLGVVNVGMVILAAGILCRFFDANLGLVVRGVVFIVLGMGFLGTNLVLLRWRGARQ